MECAAQVESTPTGASAEEDNSNTVFVAEKAPHAIDSEGSRDQRKLSDKYKGPAVKKLNGGAGRRQSRSASMELHSETQRLIREAPVNLPYHEPKKVTLMDYLKSRNSVLLRNKSTETKTRPQSNDGIVLPIGEPTSVTTDSAANSEHCPSMADSKTLPSFLPRKFSRLRQSSLLCVSSSQNKGSSIPPPPADTGSADAEDLPDLDTAWKQCVSGPLEVADGRSLTSTTVLLPQPPPPQGGNAGSCADDTCYSDVVIVRSKQRPVGKTSELFSSGPPPRTAGLEPTCAEQPLPAAAGRQACPEKPSASDVQPPPTDMKFVTTKDIIRSMIPNLPKLSLPVRKNDTDEIELTNPLESFEIFNRLAKHLKACKADRKLAPLKHTRKDENGLQMFQWHMSDAGLQEKEAAPGVLRGALKQALLSRLRIRRRVELRKKEAAYNAIKEEETAEASEVDENLDEELTDASDTDNEDETEIASQEEDGDGDDDEDTSIPKPVRNPFIDGEAEESDFDEDETSDRLSNEDGGSDSLRLRLDCESSDEPDSPSASISCLVRNAKRRARVLDDDDVTAPPALDNADVWSSPSSPRNSGSSMVNAVSTGQDHGLSNEVSQLLLGQQVNESCQVEEVDLSEDLNSCPAKGTRADHSTSFQLDEEGFLRFKSPTKSSVATVNECRRRLELNHLPNDNHAVAKKQTSFVESPHAGGMDGLLMTAFATNDCIAASEEAAALCSGGFSGIIGSSLGATALVADADRAANNARPPVDLDTCQVSTLPGDTTSDEKVAFTCDHSRKRKRVRVAVAEDLSDLENDEQILLSRSPSQSGHQTADSANSKFPRFLGKQKRKIRKDFVEEEAELSGSDDVSSDEEVALDDSAKELLQELAEADVDEVGTEEELRNQVGRVHMKSMLDADHKEVLLMQERFLPDGDLHSDSKRLRRFRWSNVDYSSFAEADHNDNEGGSSADEEMESEYAWRKERFEREQWLKQNPQDQDPLDSEAFWADMNPEVRRTAQEAVRRARAGEFSWKARSGTAVVTKRDDNLDPPPTPGQVGCVNPKVPMRGSFLAKPKEELARLARIYGSMNCNPYGAKKNGNFVFKMVPRSTADVDVHNNAKKMPPNHVENRQRPCTLGQNHQTSVDSKKPKYPEHSILAYL